MRNIRCGIVVIMLVCCSVATASAGVSIGIGLPNVSIGINLPIFPELVPISGYPVYYAPRVDANYFFYDGMYWIYMDDNWYASSWYNGPWSIVEPAYVPLYILRIPVRYYRQPPVYFRGWHRDAPPRWGQHWGRDWEQQRRGWDRWDRDRVPGRAPLPAYQRRYTGDRYPQREQQLDLHRDNYRYQPRDKAVRQHFQQQRDQRGPAPEPARRERTDEQRMRGPAPQEVQRPAPRQEQAPAVQRPLPAPQPRGPVYQEQRQEQRQQPPVQYERQSPRGQEPRFQERERQQEPRGQGNERRDEGRGRGRDN